MLRDVQLLWDGLGHVEGRPTVMEGGSQAMLRDVQLLWGGRLGHVEGCPTVMGLEVRPC